MTKHQSIKFSQELGAPPTRGTSKSDKFVLVKTDKMLEFYHSLNAYNPKDIMEVGMYEGGSMVWFDQTYQPTKLVGIDLRREPIEALEEYRADKPHIVTYYGRYQNKEGTLMAAHQNFPTGIDLIVDDASHLYDETKTTFSMLFPMLRPGGHYVIEDWSWAHNSGYQKKDATWFERPAMSNLVLQLVLMSARYGVIDSLHIDSGLICVRKGQGVFHDEMFDTSKLLRGRKMSLL